MTTHRSKSFQALSELIGSSQSVVISTHVLPDGDGLGAEIALYHFLKKLNKDCFLINPDSVPNRYLFLDESPSVFGMDWKALPDKIDLWMIVDTNDPRRVSHLWEPLTSRCKNVAFLDHHPEVESEEPLDFPKHAQQILDPTSSSIGELLFHFMEAYPDQKLDQKIALGLYVSIMTDTNSFRYARTTPEAHRIAAQMIELGVNAEEVYQNIYSSKSVSHLQLLGKLLQEIKTTAQQKIAWMEIPLKSRLKYSASSDDTQSFLNFLLLLEKSEVVCLFREEENGRVRVSMKSKGKIVVNQVAHELGGGGHAYAAGLALPSALPEVVSQVIQRLEKLT